MVRTNRTAIVNQNLVNGILYDIYKKTMSIPHLYITIIRAPARYVNQNRINS